jgi:hypothetical protein
MYHLPIIAGVSLLGAIWHKKSSCTQCKSKFTSNNECVICHAEVCNSCGKDYEQMVYKGVEIFAGGRCCNVHKPRLDAMLIEAHLKQDTELECQAEVRRKNEELARRREVALGKIGMVKSYTIGYLNQKVKGPVRLNKTIKTPYFETKDDATRELLIMAALEDSYVVQDVKEHFEKATNHRYTYNKWSYSGII